MRIQNSINRQMKHLLCWVALLITGGLYGLENPSPTSFIGNPTAAGFSVGGNFFELQFFDAQWKVTTQSKLKPLTGFPQRNRSSGDWAWELRGELQPNPSQTPLLLTQKLNINSPGILDLRYDVKGLSGLARNDLALCIQLPTAHLAGRSVIMDQNEIPLPETLGKPVLTRRSGIKEIRLPGRGGEMLLQGNFSIILQDDRKWSGKRFSLRLSLASTKNVDADSASLSARLTWIPYHCEPVSLRNVANVDLQDEVAGDQRGGWIDEGPGYDVAGLPVGPLQAGDLSFQIIDPAGNQNRAILGLHAAKSASADTSDWLPRSASIPVENNPSWRNLYLLHAAAYPPAKNKPLGTLEIRYTDGSWQDIEVQSGRDVGDWWAPATLPNAAIGWVSYNHVGRIGLYISRFTLEDKPVASIQPTLAANPGAFWMIAGLCGTKTEIPFPRTSDHPVVISAGKDWIPYTQNIDITPGSIFDFSKLLEAPAGKHGAVQTSPSGHFVFAKQPEKPVRFWGVNLSFGVNFPDHDTADRMADRIARSGYNAVRFHHYDRQLGASKGNSWDLDPVMLDRLDYLFAALKKRGIYINIDLFTYRILRRGEVEEINRDIQDIKQAKLLFCISDSAFGAWKKFATNLLQHRNPYTGLVWGEDPALSSICPVNEDTLYGTVFSASNQIQLLLQKRFARWQQETARADSDAAAWNEFLSDLQIATDRRMREHIRSLGCLVPLSGTNWFAQQAITFARNEHDYADSHAYHDHPSFPVKSWTLPIDFSQQSPAQTLAFVMRGRMPHRILGKPFASTEVRYCWPNMYRAQSGIMTSAYASLQDWDAIYAFDYSSRLQTDFSHPSSNLLALVHDPVDLLSDRIGAVIFRRGDVRPADSSVVFSVSKETAFKGTQSKPASFPDVFNQIGLITRIGASITDPQSILDSQRGEPHRTQAVVMDAPAKPSGNRIYPANTPNLLTRLEKDGVIPRNSVDLNKGIFRSANGQIELQRNPGLLKVISEQSELFALENSGTVDGRQVSVENKHSFGAFFVVATDGQPINQSKRLLVMHLTDAVPSGTRFSGEARTRVERFGQAPFLVRRGEANITIRPQETGGAWKAWAIDASGARLAKAELQQTAETLVLKTSTQLPSGQGCLAWELARP